MKIMSIEPGTHTFGPSNADLLVRTTRTGAASKAGHDLVIEVTSWEGTLEVGAQAGSSSVTFTADGGSLRVLEGTGGIQSLGDDDKAGISKTIDQEVLKRSPIEFHSSTVQPGESDGSLRIGGELAILGKRIPTEFELTVDGAGRIGGSAIVKQTDLGLKPYSILFGTLKVTDAVQVTFATKA